MDPIVYLPIEIKHREMFSRVLIASHLVKAGCAVVIGQHWAITGNRAAFPPGAYLYKSLNKIQTDDMLLTKQAGHIVAANDEEALNFIDRDGFLLGFHSAAAECDIFFAQSTVQQRVVEEEYPQLRGKVHVVGNPRLDVMALDLFEAHPEQVSPLQPYILFNTNFGTINSVWNDGAKINLGVAEQAGMFEGQGREVLTEWFKGHIAWETANHDAVTALIRWVLEHLDINIVIRPHPAERPDYWTSLFPNNPRITVIRKSDPHPWIAGAKLVVHSGCTTGLETSMLRRPAINLMPIDHPHLDRIVTYANPVFHKWEDAADALRQYVLNGTGIVADFESQTEAVLAEHLPGARDAQSAAKMAGVLVQTLRERGARFPVGPLKMRGPATEFKTTQIRKDKFSSSPEEITKTVNLVSSRAGTTVPTQIGMLMEDVYIIVPR